MFYPDYDPRDPYNRHTSSENNWIRVQMEDDGASNDQRDCKLNHPMHDDAARQEELEILPKIGTKGPPNFSVLSPSKPSKQLCRPEEVVHDILHQLRVQMEPALCRISSQALLLRRATGSAQTRSKRRQRLQKFSDQLV